MNSFLQSISIRWEKQRQLITETAAQVRVAGGMYFGYYMALGTLMPFLSLYYQRLGLTGVQIGTLGAVPVLVSSFTVLVWGSLADARGWHRPILRINLLLAAGAILLLSAARTFQELLLLISLYALVISPVVPLLDSSALGIVEKSKYTFGELRLWGSIGWSIATVVIGRFVEKLGISLIFYAYAVVISLTFILALFQSRRRQTLASPLLRGLKDLLLSQGFLLFLLSIFLVSITLGAANSFFTIYLDSIGATEAAIGWGWAVSALSEIPVLLYSGLLLKRMGSSGLLKIAFITFMVRWSLYSFIDSPTLAISVQLLHGLSFASYLIGSVTFIHERAPEGMKATAQSVFNLAAFGLGSVIGPMLGGYVYQYAGMPWMFRTLSLIIIAGFLLFLISERQKMAPAKS